MNIVIIGHGYIGEALADKLASHHAITTVSRSPSEKPHHHIKANAHHLASHLWPEADAVVYCIPPNKESAVDQHAKDVGHVVQCFERHDKPPQLFIYISSTGIYDQQGDYITEQTPIEPKTIRAKRLAAAEEAVIKSDLNHVIIRPSRIYGPGRAGMLGSLVKGQASLSGDENYSHHIHRDDLVDIIDYIIQHPTPSSLYIASDPEPEKTNTINHWLSTRTGLPLDANTRTSATSPPRKIVPLNLIEQRFSFSVPNYRSGYEQIITEHEKLPRS